MCRVLLSLSHRFSRADAGRWDSNRWDSAVFVCEMGACRHPDRCGNRPAEILLLGGYIMKVVVWKSPRYLNGLLRKLFGFGKEDSE